MSTLQRMLAFFGVMLAVVAFSVSVFAQPQPASPLQKIDIIRLDPQFDKLVPPNVKVERIVSGRRWVEGPVWNRKEGYLLFSDIPVNSVIKWREGEGTSVYLKPSGYTGKGPFEGAEPGSNGLTFDLDGRLVLAAHGDRRIARLEKNGKQRTLVERFEGKRTPMIWYSNPTAISTSPIRLSACRNPSTIRARKHRSRAFTNIPRTAS